VSAPDRIDTLIGAGARIDGNITFSGGLRIDGEVTGNVTARPGNPTVLVIGEQGRVHGELRATRVVVNGIVAGSVCATELIELQSRARVSGELRYAGLEIHRGALIEARLNADAAPAGATVRPAAPPLDRPERTPLAAAGRA
jgi:cytoskeletal protein CcmA (bactofilin family)